MSSVFTSSDGEDWHEIGYLSEDGIQFGKEEVAGIVHQGESCFPRVERTVTFESAEFSPSLLSLWDEPKPVVNLTKVLKDARAYRKTTFPRGLLLRRLNSRWRDHRHPDARSVVVERGGGVRQVYPHVLVTPTDDGLQFDPMPVPTRDDPDYYLRNPS